MDVSTITVWQYLAIAALVTWSYAWKAFGLWMSAKNNDLAWFVAILLINSLGLLEIFYIFVFSKRTKLPKE